MKREILGLFHVNSFPPQSPNLHPFKRKEMNEEKLPNHFTAGKTSAINALTTISSIQLAILMEILVLFFLLQRQIFSISL